MQNCRKPKLKQKYKRKIKSVLKKKNTHKKKLSNAQIEITVINQQSQQQRKKSRTTGQIKI